MRLMLQGKELGAAIEVAINKKIAANLVRSKAAIARHFEVTPQSLNGWLRTGAVSKSRLPDLWSYFADVVPLSHWGLPELKHESTDAPDQMPTTLWPFEMAKLHDVLRLNEQQHTQLDTMIAWYLMGALSTADKSPKKHRTAA